MKNIDKGIRATNYIIDFVVVFFFWITSLIILGVYYYYYHVLFYAIMFSYYLLFEVATGQTLGKMVTKTRVVYKNGNKPSFFRIVIRTFWRLIPFDIFSYVFGYEFGMHDLLSSTKLIIKA